MTNVYILDFCPSSLTVHDGMLLCRDESHDYSCYNITLRRESVMDVEPGCGFDTSRTHRVARKRVAVVTGGHPWCSVECRVANSVTFLRDL